MSAQFIAYERSTLVSIPAPEGAAPIRYFPVRASWVTYPTPCRVRSNPCTVAFGSPSAPATSLTPIPNGACATSAMIAAARSID